MAEIQISKEDLLNRLYNMNYKVVINIKEGSKFVEFTNPLAIDSNKVSHCYSMEWTDEEIRRDVVYDLLKWSGLKITQTLDY